MKKKSTELLVEKEFTKWLRDENTLIEDIAEIEALLNKFEIVYGIKLELVYDNLELDAPKR